MQYRSCDVRTGLLQKIPNCRQFGTLRVILPACLSRFGVIPVVSQYSAEGVTGITRPVHRS